MNKKTLVIIIIAILIMALGAGGYFYWNKKARANRGAGALDEISNAAKKVTESITKGVLPDIQTNLFENKPDLNPADKANPYKNIKTNPF